MPSAFLTAQSIDTNLARDAEEKRRLREAYEEKVRRVQQQVLALRRQQRDNEKNKLERLKAKSDHKVRHRSATLPRTGNTCHQSGDLSWLRRVCWSICSMQERLKDKCYHVQ